MTDETAQEDRKIISPTSDRIIARFIMDRLNIFGCTGETSLERLRLMFIYFSPFDAVRFCLISGKIVTLRPFSTNNNADKTPSSKLFADPLKAG